MGFVVAMEGGGRAAARFGRPVAMETQRLKAAVDSQLIARWGERLSKARYIYIFFTKYLFISSQFHHREKPLGTKITSAILYPEGACGREAALAQALPVFMHKSDSESRLEKRKKLLFCGFNH